MLMILININLMKEPQKIQNRNKEKDRNNEKDNKKIS